MKLMADYFLVRTYQRNQTKWKTELNMCSATARQHYSMYVMVHSLNQPQVQTSVIFVIPHKYLLLCFTMQLYYRGVSLTSHDGAPIWLLDVLLGKCPLCHEYLWLCHARVLKVLLLHVCCARQCWAIPVAVHYIKYLYSICNTNAFQFINSAIYFKKKFKKKKKTKKNYHVENITPSWLDIPQYKKDGSNWGWQDLPIYFQVFLRQSQKREFKIIWSYKLCKYIHLCLHSLKIKRLPYLLIIQNLTDSTLCQVQT